MNATNTNTTDTSIYFNQMQMNLLAISGKTLRAGIPQIDLGTGYSYRVTADDIVAEGVARDILEDIAYNYDFNISYHHVSEESLLKMNDPASACQHDVSKGLLDLCAAPLYIVPNRLLLSPMSSSLGQDSIRLVLVNNTGSLKEDSVWDLLGTPLRPFSPMCWIWLLLALLYTSSSTWIMNKRFDYRDRPTRQTRATFGGDIIYQSVLDFSLGANAQVFMVERAHAIFQKIVIAGSVLFGLLVRSAYTSSLVAALVSKEKVDIPYESLADILDDKGIVCVSESFYEGVITVLKAEYMSYKRPFDLENLIKKVTTTEINELNESNFTTRTNPDGQCTAALMSSYVFLGRQKSGMFCNGAFVGEPLMAIPVSFPISEEYRDTLSYFTSGITLNGKLVEYTNKIMQGSQCQLYMRQSADDNTLSTSGYHQLGPYELFLPISLSFFSTTLGLIVFLYYYWLHPRILKKRQTHKDHLNAKRSARSQMNAMSGHNLKKVLKHRSAQELIEVIHSERSRGGIVKIEDYRAAVNALPDTSLLVKLVCELQASDRIKNEYFLQSLQQCEIYEFAEQNVLNLELLASAVNDKFDPKGRLIDLLLITKENDAKVTKWREIVREPVED